MMTIDNYSNEAVGGLAGRRRIYTDYENIDGKNVVDVLQKSMAIHEQNILAMRYLLNYEKGVQPLCREKKIRSDIDIEIADNVANQIVEFKLGYNWGNPIKFVQRGNKDFSGNNPDTDDDAITRLNEMNDEEMSFAKDQELARYVEICGLGYQLVDCKRDDKATSVFDLVTLNPLFAFVVYRNDVYQTPIMGVTYRKDHVGNRFYTCYTTEAVYIVKNCGTQQYDENNEQIFEWREDIRSGEKNPLGMIPIVEFFRAYDRMGCFERQISDMDALNIEVSDYANNIAQDTQGMWWGNDFEFPVDENGKQIKPVGGQWIMTKTTANGKAPTVQSLESRFDYNGVQANIESKRNLILQKCYVPLQSDPGGGSTASAMSLSSGWSAAEANACKEELIIKRAKLQVIALELKAIELSGRIKQNDPLRKLRLSDIDAKFTRQKTFDLGTKTNAMVTMIKNGIHGRIAMQTVDLFPDIAQAWADSKDLIEKYQENLFKKEEPKPVEETTDNPQAENDLQDITGQKVNSPLVDGMETKDTEATK